MDKTTEELYKGNEGWKDLIPTTYKWKEALEFAKMKHEGQLRDEGIPYFEHIKGVMNILIREANTTDDVILTIAALHDVLEDTDCSYEEVEAKFGKTVASAVNLLTRKENQSFEDYAKAIFTNNQYPYARKVKLADRLHNLRSLPQTGNPEKIAKKISETERFILPYEKQSPRILINKIKEEIESLKKRQEPNKPSSSQSKEREF